MESQTCRPAHPRRLGRRPPPFSSAPVRSPKALLLVSTSFVLIFLAVAQTMLILAALGGLARQAQMALQAALLVAFLWPPAYFLLLRPLHLQKERLKEAEKEARALAFYDALTSLPNRLLLRERAERAFAEARRQGTSVAVIFIDLDDFKQINDAFGHAVGDAYLKAVADTLTQSVRQSDTVARIGGDEFVWVGLVRDYDEAETIARKILHSLTRPIEFGGRALKIGASIGIAVHPRDGDDLDALIQAADGAMYAAKRGGKNGFHSSVSRHYNNSTARESAYSYFRD